MKIDIVEGVNVKEFVDLVALLKEKQLTISAAESCTGGLFASETVAVPDASKVLNVSFVTYSEQAKCEFVRVNEETIEKFGVVSEQVAIEMASGVAAVSKSDIGVGITGFAGPRYSDDDDTVGTVCFGFYVNGKTVSATKHFGDVGRNTVRELAVIYAAKTLISLIKVTD